MRDTLHREAIDRLKRGRACLCCDRPIYAGALCRGCKDWACTRRVTGRDAIELEQAYIFDHGLAIVRRAVADATEEGLYRYARQCGWRG